jgi:hypothetical protein
MGTERLPPAAGLKTKYQHPIDADPVMGVGIVHTVNRKKQGVNGGETLGVRKFRQNLSETLT